MDRARGIVELATDMERFGLTAEDFEGPCYVRLARIRALLAVGGARRRLADAGAGHRGDQLSTPLCRLCGAEITGRSWTWGCRRRARATCPPTSSTRRDLLPAARADLHRVPPGAAARLHPGRGHLQPLRVLLLVQRLLGRARQAFVDEAVARLGLDPDSFVVEVASNDGYLLQHVVARGIRSLGIEPAANVAEAATRRACRPR